MKKNSVPSVYLYKQVVDAKLFIDSHFREKIDLGLIANQACFSKFHFHRIFKECYNKTPLEYLTSLRLKEAKLLLSKGVIVKEVCYQIGFESQSSFIKLFKKQELMTPAAYSRLVIRKGEAVALEPLNYIPADYAEYLGWKK